MTSRILGQTASSAPLGVVVPGAAFFLAVLLAAVTSSISILEIPVAFVVDEFDVERSMATRGLFVLLVVWSERGVLPESVETAD